ncbi:NmrA domain-containing protein [Mycena indigotica]|uniref:NmrA domain-containing protein n=1 Tax=Mycena indigotica TaxID=2126181 RepID=A0A8H6VX24_9AGAR|nr:NmrA domain-containing protein [Mycena indigotica]XP_037217391.1 NmrA domain-containing protein [Mycena indigotica]KAF7297019.1 NmrA domain-containing protein [Mycena indigotica]KAF7297032.1 NmrA domain-containing protein [Mycena indigotica]
MSKRIFTVFGATGKQGAAIIESALADGTFTLRAVSRKVDSDASKALIARGVEVVSGDLFDKESLKKAIRGSEVVFGITNFWDPSVFPADPKGAGEITQGKNLVDAAKEEGVKYLLWSSLPNISEASKGEWKHVYHCDNKAIVGDYLAASGVPHSIVYTAWFGENLWAFGSMVPAESGNGYTIPIPKYSATDKQQATWVKNDLGPAVLALAKNYNTDKGKEVGILGGSFPVVTLKFTYPELAAAISKALGKPVNFFSVETTGMAELDEMFLFQAKTEGMYPDAIPNPKLAALGVKFGTLDQFIKEGVLKHFS